MNLVIIDTNCANLTSVKFAIERLGINPIISDNADTILSADKLILPGVGTADFAMNEIKNKNLIEVIRQVKKPLLGICLGMQLLGSYSEEGKDNKIQTLNIINAPTQKLNTQLPLPHMGWNQLSILDKNHPLFYGIDEGEFVYFVHSYRMPVGDNTLATCDYGEKFSAIIGKDNFFGMQFHPEKSGKVGEKLLKNFVENI
ncbi:Imidazole glycerol phosphate synthase subunit HisH [Moraxella lacunata]|uniref:Imidazole glycerol phosphate synthase subunit HisH n=1 Tax=Moraxella lacunata TaxID=477 RepID=A0A378TQD1_MORLA|nr:imidazole glycerol phosphate synthase subunit HisH [Moraxella lacunata]STZ62927.1 Imidazole glycerol phosphate synthase subunit HisH [Moraxella lacunata]